MNARMEWTVKFLRYLGYRYSFDKLSNIAAMLTLTSLLSIIPLLTVLFAIMAALPLGQNLENQIQTFIFNNFVPAVSQSMEQTLIGFIHRASSMKALGFTILFITAIMLLKTIDAGFNQIWRTTTRRKAVVAFIIYWLVLVLSPLFLGLSLGLSSYFTSMLIMTDSGREISSHLTVLLPWILTTIGLGILYLVIPNSKVKFSHAFIGAFVAGLLFELAKKLFTMYVTSFPLQEIIFGALSAVPLFLIWVYLSWLIILLGAEVCHGLENFKLERDDSTEKVNYFFDCLKVIKVIDEKNVNNVAISREFLIDKLTNLSDTSILVSLKELLRLELIEESTEGNYSLLKSLSEYSLHDYIQHVKWKLPSRGEIIESEYYSTYLGQELLFLLVQIETRPTCSLRQLYRQV